MPRRRRSIAGRKNNSFTSIRRDIKRLQRDVNGGAELKFVDFNSSIATAANLATVAQMYTIAQGTNEGERSGMDITIKRMWFKMRITVPTTTTVANSSDVVRIIIWKDKQTNGALPSGTDVLLTTGTAGLNHHYNKDQDHRNVILWDQTFVLNSGAGGGSTTTYSPINKFVEFNRQMNVPIKYNNSVTTGAIASIESNNIYLSHVSLNAVATIELDLRTFYTDS